MQTLKQEVEDYWVQCILQWYPNLHTQTYFLPPLHFNRVPYRVETVAAEQVLVPEIAHGGVMKQDGTTNTQNGYIRANDGAIQTPNACSIMTCGTRQTQNRYNKTQNGTRKSPFVNIKTCNETIPNETKYIETQCGVQQAQNGCMAAQEKIIKVQNEASQSQDRYVMKSVADSQILNGFSETPDEVIHLKREGTHIENVRIRTKITVRQKRVRSIMAQSVVKQEQMEASLTQGEENLTTHNGYIKTPGEDSLTTHNGYIKTQGDDSHTTHSGYIKTPGDDSNTTHSGYIKTPGDDSHTTHRGYIKTPGDDSHTTHSGYIKTQGDDSLTTYTGYIKTHGQDYGHIKTKGERIPTTRNEYIKTHGQDYGHIKTKGERIPTTRNEYIKTHGQDYGHIKTKGERIPTTRNEYIKTHGQDYGYIKTQSECCTIHSGCINKQIGARQTLNGITYAQDGVILKQSIGIQSQDGVIPKQSIGIQSQDGVIPKQSVGIQSQDGVIPKQSIGIHSQDGYTQGGAKGALSGYSGIHSGVIGMRGVESHIQERCVMTKTVNGCINSKYYYIKTKPETVQSEHGYIKIYSEPNQTQNELNNFAQHIISQLRDGYIRTHSGISHSVNTSSKAQKGYTKIHFGTSQSVNKNSKAQDGITKIHFETSQSVNKNSKAQDGITHKQKGGNETQNYHIKTQGCNRQAQREYSMTQVHNGYTVTQKQVSHKTPDDSSQIQTKISQTHNQFIQHRTNQTDCGVHIINIRDFHTDCGVHSTHIRDCQTDCGVHSTHIRDCQTDCGVHSTHIRDCQTDCGTNNTQFGASQNQNETINTQVAGGQTENGITGMQVVRNGIHNETINTHDWDTHVQSSEINVPTEVNQPRSDVIQTLRGTIRTQSERKETLSPAGQYEPSPHNHWKRSKQDVTLCKLSMWPRHREIIDPPTVYDSDVRDDRALQQVLYCLRALADNSQPEEVMMVISQLQFGKYLHHPSFAAAYDCFKRPKNLTEQTSRHFYSRGDFDILIIHRDYGLFILEIKSVGENFIQLKMTEQQEDEVVVKKVQESLKQLNKAETVLKHLVSDIATLSVKKSVVMPNITKRQLSRALSSSSVLGQVMCQCLGVKTVDDAINICLLSDQLPDKATPWEITPTNLNSLQIWGKCLVHLSETTPITSKDYTLLVARFCGPATSVDVHCVTSPRLDIRTLGEGVSETGERVASLTLFPQQVDLLHLSPPRVFVTGPPGTGKTVVLVLQGLEWLRLGHDVHVVSTWSGSRAATIVIKHQLKQTITKSAVSTRVHRHHYDLENDGEGKSGIKRLESFSKGRQLCMLIDEVVPNRKLFMRFCDSLLQTVPAMYMWCASMRQDVRPLCLEEVKMTTPLRSPPVVIRKLMETYKIKLKEVPDYTFSDVPVPTEGPTVRRIAHVDGHLGHTGEWPNDCVKCGYEVARVLKELNVGMGSFVDERSPSNGPPPLQYRDVLLLCFGYPNDVRVDSGGRLPLRANGVVEGLRACHVPVHVIEKDDEDAIRGMALGVRNEVTVANWNNVHGLERKVVVVEIRGFAPEYDLYAISRCSSQLVILESKL